MVQHAPVGESIPANTPHAVSVQLPTWKSNVGYEEGEKWVVDKMQTGYPRFFIHRSIRALGDIVVAKYGSDTESAMLFPSYRCAHRATDFLRKNTGIDSEHTIRILQFVPDPAHADYDALKILPRMCAVIYPTEHWPVAKQIWQHTGDGISSRSAEYCQKCLVQGSLVERSSVSDLARARKGPKRYQKEVTASKKIEQKTGIDKHASCNFVEERYGRNLDVTIAAQAKLAVRRRVASSIPANVDIQSAQTHPELVNGASSEAAISEDDVYLCPMGMSAIYTAQRTLERINSSSLPSIMYGFPYVDTLKILEKWGAGVVMYGHGSSAELDDLQRRLEGGERFLALYCEFPGNPLLKTPDIVRIRRLADQFGFAVVVDETIGNFLNIHVMPYADVVVSSLTKIFSGDCNVMGGCAILNASGKLYSRLKASMELEYEDTVFEEDALFLERNSRDFVSRVARVNANAEAICDMLLKHPRIKRVNYPKHNECRQFYDACKLPTGGYGGLLSCTFYSVEDSAAFFDHLDTAKGPSLGTNFTLASPYVLLAHYGELEWAAEYGCEANLVRFSVGLEDVYELQTIFARALAAIPT